MRITMEVPATETGSQSSEPTMGVMLLGLCVDTSLASQVRKIISRLDYRNKHSRMSIDANIGCQLLILAEMFYNERQSNNDKVNTLYDDINYQVSNCSSWKPYKQHDETISDS